MNQTTSNEKPSLCKARRLWQNRLIIGIGSTITTKNVTSKTSSNHLKFSIDYYSSVSGPPRLGVVVVIVSYSVIRTTPGTGSSITSMIVSSTTAAFCLGGFFGAIFATVFRGRLFGVPRFAAFLREGWSLGLHFLNFARKLGALLPTFCNLFARRKTLLCFDHSCFLSAAEQSTRQYPSAICHATLNLAPAAGHQNPPAVSAIKNGGSPSNSILISDTLVVVFCPQKRLSFGSPALCRVALTLGR